jgi:hypothetical protein
MAVPLTYAVLRPDIKHYIVYIKNNLKKYYRSARRKTAAKSLCPQDECIFRVCAGHFHLQGDIGLEVLDLNGK